MTEYKNNMGTPKPRRLPKWLWFFLPVILVFVSISSFIAGMNIGHTTDSGMGQLVDTIILSPDESVQTISICGWLRNSDGTPFANQLLEIHSAPIQTITDENGYFHFSNVSLGTHKLSVLADDGTVLMSREIFVSRQPETTSGKVKKNNAGYTIEVAMASIEIQLNIEIGTDNDMIIHENILSMDRDGTVVNDKGQVIGTVTDVEQGFSSGMLEPQEVIETLPTSTEIEEETKEERLEIPATVSALETAEALPQPSAQEEVPTIDETTAVPPTAGTTKNTEQNDSDQNTRPTKPVAPTEPTRPTEPTPEETLPNPVPVEVYDVAYEKKWTQNAKVSLFENRTGVGADRKLAPGSKGVYQFQVINANEYPVFYTIKMSAPDEQLLIPLHYRLKSGETYVCGDQDNWLTAEQLYQKAVNLGTNITQPYTLEWQWPFDGGNDALDTRIGSAANPEYMIIISIQITQSL